MLVSSSRYTFELMKKTYHEHLRLPGQYAWDRQRGGNQFATEAVGSLRLTNVSTVFSFKRPNRTDDGEVLLISPTANLRQAKAAYDEFVKSLKFGQ
jgi:hypothetical protein